MSNSSTDKKCRYCGGWSVDLLDHEYRCVMRPAPPSATFEPCASCSFDVCAIQRKCVRSSIGTTPHMTADKATDKQKSAAFEWLRSVALGQAPTLAERNVPRLAAIALDEWHRCREAELATRSATRLTDWLRDNAPDCGDNSCLFGGRGKGGMRTNGGCRCFRDVRPDMKRIFIERMWQALAVPERGAWEDCPRCGAAILKAHPAEVDAPSGPSKP